jgi:hypothetical protein
MRIVLASLIAATALASVAQAQTPATQPTPDAQPAAPATPPAAPAAPDATATPPAAAPAAEPPPSLPTSGNGAVILSVIEKICVPLVRGGNLDDIGKANSALGMKKNRRDNTWTMPLDPANKDTSITIQPPGSNKDVCRAEVHYAINDDKPIVSAINIWSFLHQPELMLQANYVAVDPDGVKRVRKSWEHFDAANSTAVNFSTWTKPDDSSLNAKYSTGELFYQERKLG